MSKIKLLLLLLIPFFVSCVTPITVEPLDYVVKRKELQQKEIDLKQKKEESTTNESSKDIRKVITIYYGCLMVKSGAADGMVAGAAHSTADILKPALKYIKTAQHNSLVSGFFLAVLPFPQKTAENKNFSPILGLADCAVNPNPNPQQLAEIAINSAATMKKLTNTEPKVAMLSFSTRGSATHQMVEKVTEATKIAQKLAPALKLDGEMQLDAALIEEVAQSKSPQSSVAGKANVLVFPDLNSGNIGYKLIQRLGMAQVIGPILQGMAAPVNDLSRGCTVEEIVNLVAITSLQS